MEYSFKRKLLKWDQRIWTFFFIIFSLTCFISGISLPKNEAKTNLKEAKKDEEGLWLEDFISEESIYDRMQGDQPEVFDVSRMVPCPPPPSKLPKYSCLRPSCNSDKECAAQGRRCCNNGCKFTCMDTMAPPAVLDWNKEPTRQHDSGNTWLLPKPSETGQELLPVESCSTSEVEDDEDALLCPHGFICHIEDPGDASHNVPNRGRCIQARNGLHESFGRKFHLKTDYIQDDVCVFESAIFVDGSSFTYDKHPCSCHKGSITCKVGKKGGS